MWERQHRVWLSTRPSQMPQSVQGLRILPHSRLRSKALHLFTPLSNCNRLKRELAATRKEMISLSRRSAKPPSPKTPRVPSREVPARSVGTRISNRLRGKNEFEDEWQPIPDEWLAGGSGTKTDDEEYVMDTPRRSSARLTGARTRAVSSRNARIESDNESDLAELSSHLCAFTNDARPQH